MSWRRKITESSMTLGALAPGAATPGSSSAPSITQFTANAGLSSSSALALPSIPFNTCNVSSDYNAVTLNWTVDNLQATDTSTLSINQQIGTLESSFFDMGTFQYYDLLDNTSFVLNAVNAYGVASGSVPIFVQPMTTPAVTITSFTATPSSITSGSSVTLSWAVSSNACALWLGAYQADIDLSTLGGLNAFDPSQFTNLSDLAIANTTQYTVPNVTQTTQFVLFAQDVVGPYVWFPTPTSVNNSLVQVS